MTDDAALLKKFITEHSDTAFRELVRQRIDFVYGAALRQVGGDVHLAQEVTQSVFLDLARKARSLTGRPSLAGWFFTSTRFAATKARRTRARRLTHETEAHAMHETLSARSETNATAADWKDVRVVLDAAMHELSERDREAILLRFFEGRSFSEVGAAIGLAENSARMRVDRAIEKLRERLAQRGITSTAAALGLTLAHQPIVAAPAGLAATVAGGALATAAVTAGGAGVGAALWAASLMSTTKLVLVTFGAAATLGLGAWLGARQAVDSRSNPDAARVTVNADTAALREENRRLREEFARRSPERTGSSTTGAGVAVSGQRIESLRVLTELQRRKLGKLEFEFVSEDAQLQPAFVELFALAPPEQEVLQRAIDASRERLAALVRANTTMERTPSGDVKFAVRPFPETGGAAYDDLMRTFATTLGPERYNAFLALGAEQTEKMLGRFGTSERVITLSRDLSGAEPAYRINDLTRHGPNNNSNYVSDRLTAERFVRELGPIADLLPAEFVKR